jgi:protein-tyrosine phosphatase
MQAQLAFWSYRMEIHQLEYFAALARELNYTNAAKKCYISRQAMRQAVQALEDEYHIKLVENRRNRLSLTAAGKTLQKNAEEVLDAVRRTDSELRSCSLHSRAVRIGVSVSLIPFFAPEILSLLSTLSTPFPSLRFEIVKQDADSLLTLLDQQQLDAVLLADLGCVTEGYHRTVLRRNRFAVLLSETHPLSGRKSLKLRDLEGQTISVMSSPDRCFRPLVEALNAQGIHAELRVVPDAYEAFRIVRNEGCLCVDRLELTEDGLPPVGLEIDLPIDDFPNELQTVLLITDSPPQELLRLSRYMKEQLEKNALYAI